MKQINRVALVYEGLEVNDEEVEKAAVDVVDVGVECDFEEVNRSWVCVLVHFVVENIHSHGGENEKEILGFGFRSVRVKI